MLRIEADAFRTHPGRQREANEDSFFARNPLYVVADGMGGAQAGEVASRMAAETFDAELSGEGTPEQQLAEKARAANEQIHAHAAADASRAGMGTTLTAVLVGTDDAAIAHVGDSRAYLVRDGELRRLTRDHSLVEELRRQGKLTEEQAETHPQRSIITRALGPEAQVEVDTMTVGVRHGDLLLLCSDGLTTMLAEAQILELVESANGDLDVAVGVLIDAANAAGGRDNITVLLARVVDDDPAGRDTALTETGTMSTAAVREAVRERDALEESERDIGPPAVRPVRPATDPPETFQPEERPRAAKAPPPPPSAPPAAESSRRRRWPGRLARVALGLAVLAVVVAGAVVGVRQVHFLGTDDGGRVAVFRGLPYDLPLGVELYEPQYASPLQTGSLDRDRRAVVRDHELRSRADAFDLIADIESDEGIQGPQQGGVQ
ncbi:MAG: Stp1/IreP family PP2C-type Ser/Thr phosphatase [Solirubrobacterales bacterium]